MRKITFYLILLLFSTNGICQINMEKKYSETENYIWENYIPESGKSEVVAGEMLRILYNVKDEAKRNGNINSDREDKRDLKFIYKTLKNSGFFDSKNLKEIKQDIKRLKKIRKPYTSDDIYDRLSKRIVDYYWKFGDLKLK